MLEQDPDTLGLRPALAPSAARLTALLTEMTRQGIDTLGPLNGHSPDERENEFVAAFVDRVAPSGGTLADSAIRHAARQGGERLLRESSSGRDDVREGQSSHGLSTDLFCLIWKHFFSAAMEECLVQFIAEGLKSTVPLLAADPTGQVAMFLAEQLAELIPDPCEEQAKTAGGAQRVVSVAEELVQPTAADLLDPSRLWEIAQ